MNIAGVNLDESAIGNVAFLAADPKDVISYYAGIYRLPNGKVVLSYRGTPFPGHPDWNDVIHGWAISLGDANAAQPQAAPASFADAVSIAGNYELR